jgi:hypothetical protein
MSKIERQSRPSGRTRPALAVVALSLLLAACGGGENGGGDGAYALKVSFGNQTDAPAELVFNDGEPITVESCRGGVYTFEMPETDWVLTVNGETAIDSLNQDPMDLDNNAIARLWLREDGTIDLQAFEPGSNVTPPATLSICT